ncbi:MAG: hypothetical protein AAGE52_09935 [Myxococcota bacterium]
MRFLSIAALLLASKVSAQQYQITAIGFPPAGGEQGAGVDINGIDQVLGTYDPGPGMESNAFVWDAADGFRVIDNDEGEVEVSILTDDGVVGGTLELDNDRADPREMDCFPPTSRRMFTWDGAITELGWIDEPEVSMPDCGSILAGMNRDLDIVGTSGNPAGGGVPVFVRDDAFTPIWEHVDGDEDDNWFVSGITDDGTILGRVQAMDEFASIGFIFDGSVSTFDHRMIDETGNEVEGLVNEDPVAVTRRGLVAGTGQSDVPQVFLYDSNDDTFTILGDGEALDMNDVGTVVGLRRPGGGYIYAGGSWQPFVDLLPDGHGWAILSVTAINDRGAVTGSGMFEGDLQAFFAEPIQEEVDLQVELTDVRAPEGQVGLEVTVRNIGANVAPRVQLVVSGPASTASAELPEECETGSSASEVRCTIPALAAEGEEVFSLRFDLSEEPPFTFQATVSSDGDEQNPADNMSELMLTELMDPIFVPGPEDPGADLECSVSSVTVGDEVFTDEIPMFRTGGDPFRMSSELRNNGPESAPNVVVRGSVLGAMVLEAFVEREGGRQDCTLNDGGGFICRDLGNLPMGESVRVEVQATRADGVSEGQIILRPSSDRIDPNADNTECSVSFVSGSSGCAVGGSSAGATAFLLLLAFRRRRAAIDRNA